MTESRDGHPGYGSSREQLGHDPRRPVDPYGSPAYEGSSSGPAPLEYRDPRYDHHPGHQPAVAGREPAGWFEPPDRGEPPGWNQRSGSISERPSPRRRALKVWIIFRLAVAAAGSVFLAYVLIMHLTSHKPTDAAAAKPSPAQRAGSSAPTASHPVSHRGDLRKYLIASPARSRPWPKPPGSHGKLSLRQAIRMAGSNRGTFAEYRFRDAAVRSWITVNSTWVDMRLYRFRSPNDARAFFRIDTHRSAGLTPASGQSSVRGVPGARAFAELKPDSYGILSVLAFGVKGDVEFIADVAEHARTARLGVVNKLMRDQYGKL